MTTKDPKLNSKLEVEYYTVQTGVGTTSPKTIWETRENWMTILRDGRREWEKMDNETREEVVRAVQRGLERLYEKGGEWIPEGLEVKSGVYMDITMRILFTDAGKQVERNREATTFKLKNAKVGLDKMLEDFKAAGIPVDVEEDEELEVEFIVGGQPEFTGGPNGNSVE